MAAYQNQQLFEGKKILQQPKIIFPKMKAKWRSIQKYASIIIAECTNLGTTVH